MQVPTIGIVKLKKKGYLPTNSKVNSGIISYKSRRYYVSMLAELLDKETEKPQGGGIGIDLSVKDLEIMLNGIVKPNINKTLKMIKLNQKLRREQRRLSKKYESKKKRGEKTAAYSANIEKKVAKIQQLSYFKIKLTSKAKENEIEVRIVNRFYPGSKICSKC